MEALNNFVSTVNGIVWGPPMLIVIVGGGFFLTLGLRFMPLLRLGTGVKMLWAGRQPQGSKGEITPFRALMTSLSATIGTGNIGGVATAVFAGGPGAVFWMWITALVGMATKYAEAVCAVQYREVDKNGHHVGGPMYFIRNGMGKSWAWLAVLFALFGALAGFGIGNGVQANAVADVLSTQFQVPKLATAVVLTAIVGAVLIGGLSWISAVAARLVPLMAAIYVIGGLAVILANAVELPRAFGLIFEHAFTPVAAAGGFAGAAVRQAIRFGVARGVFSNEAGLGSAPIAHAAAQTQGPVQQGLVAMLGTFIDTIIVCSITGLVIVGTNAYINSDAGGASLTIFAFNQGLASSGWIVAIVLPLFAFTTILGWSYYSERCVQYLFGEKSIMPFRVLWSIAVFFGPLLSLSFVWNVSDTLNAMMALPNMIGLVVLSPVVFKLTQQYFSK